MGKTMKWLKGILGINKEKHQKPNSGVRQSCLGHSVREPIIESTDDDSLICQNPHTIPPNLTPSEAAWLKSFYSDSDNEQQSRHAIAVAAATAAAADAAVAAAHAAAAVVRLTSQGRRSGSMAGNIGGASGREKWGAIKIQTVFRGYLARKALRALKGLVKVQAIVRGYLVRKQADATFLSMQVLIRSAQSTIRAQRTRALINSTSQLHHPPPKNSLESLDEATSQQRNSFHSTSKRISASFENTNTDINAVEESPKIVEMDTGRPKSRSRRSMVSDSGDENEEDDCASSHHTQSSTCLYHQPPPPRLSIPEWQHSDSLEEHNQKWVDDCRGYTTAQSTPRFATCCGNNFSPAITPAKSVCVESLFRDYGKYCPNYMADTQSFKAKLRSQSAPKQRPAEQYPTGTKRRQSIHEMMGSRNSHSGVKMQRSCSNAQEAINFKNAVISKLGRSTEFVRDQCSRDY